MWLTDGFSVTFFGRWWGAVCIHVSHIQLLYMVINVWRINVWRGHSCAATIHGNEHVEN